MQENKTASGCKKHDMNEDNRDDTQSTYSESSFSSLDTAMEQEERPSYETMEEGSADAEDRTKADGSNNRKGPCYNRALAEATVMDEENICDVEAQPVDIDASAKKQEKRERQRTAFHFSSLVLVCLSFALVKVFVHRRKNIHARIPYKVAAFLDATDAPTEAPTTTSLNMMLIEDLPNSTLDSLLHYGTPQWLAYDWLSQHPKLESLPNWRRKQLFALATFYHSMEGPHWPDKIRERWMDYSDECYWHSALFGEFLNGEYKLDNLILSEPCNEYGEFQSLSLSALSLSKYEVSVPPEIALLTSLTSLELSGIGANTTIDTFLPTEILSMDRLTIVDFEGNDLSGPISLDSMTNLVEIDLGNNPLYGSISSDIGRITNLVELNLCQAGMSGTLAREVGQLSQLEELKLQSNFMTGEIPNTLGLLSSMTALALGDNLFSGSIPKEIGALQDLEELNLSDMPLLTGSIPAELFSLPNLKFLNLKGSIGLSGTIPDSLCHLKDSSCFYGKPSNPKQCVLDFDCSPTLCGCDCPCQP